MPVPAAAEKALGELAARAAALAAASVGNLLECFAAVPDPRDPRGIRHSLPCVLALCTAAVLCGNTAVEDVTAWVHAAPQEVLAAAGARRNALVPRPGDQEQVSGHPGGLLELAEAPCPRRVGPQRGQRRRAVRGLRVRGPDALGEILRAAHARSRGASSPDEKPNGYAFELR